MLSREFYEHLYALESLNTQDQSWIYKVDEDDPHLLAVHKIIGVKKKHTVTNKQLKLTIDDKTFIDLVKSGVVDGHDLSNRFNCRIEKFYNYIHARRDIYNILVIYRNFWQGFIALDTQTGDMMFARSKVALARNIGGKNQYFQCQGRFELTDMYQYKKQHPDFQLAEEELLNNEIIRL